MLKNIYTPLSGAIAQEQALEIIANNLANVNTVGFKGDKVTFTLQEAEPDRSYRSPIPPANYKVDLAEVFPLKGNELSYVGIAGMERDTTQGPAITTHNPKDLMIEGKGYFQVQTNDGLRLTRNGSMRVSPDGVLVTQHGDPVLGTKGVINIGAGDFKVNVRGELYQNGELVDQILIKTVPDENSLERVGKNYLFYGGDSQDLVTREHPQISQGYLEGSNVNPVKSLTAMIMAHRSYEAYQKAVSNFDQMMDKSSNTIGDVRA